MAQARVTAAQVASSSVSLGWIAVDDGAIHWLEGRPDEDGRSVLVRWQPGGGAVDLTPAPWNVRTRVHEYGGGAYCVAGGMACFSHVLDGRLYRLEADGPPRAVTPPGPWRFADGSVDRRRRLLFCVGERHEMGPEPENCLVRVDLDGVQPPVVVARGHDFYAAPRLSPDGRTLAWLAWRHPEMPWDGTELWRARLEDDGRVGDARPIAGGSDESILEPTWTADGALVVVSDRSGWWNPYRVEGDGLQPLCPMAAEWARPPWVLGGAQYDVLADGSLLGAVSAGGRWRLVRVDPQGQATDIATPYSDVAFVRAAPGGAVFVASAPAAPAAVVRLEVASGACTVLRRGAAWSPEPAAVSPPQSFDFASAGGRRAYGLYYAPLAVAGPASPGRPPLVVRCHGGPTAAAPAGFDPVVQFWTQRGVGVLDVNYAGSSGYGRRYRRALDGAWGVADVDDCVAAARHAVAAGWAGADRLLVRGSSAGGFTVLCALAFHDVFAAGASYYGIADLEALRRETHKFESRYDQRLIGPYPVSRERYRDRSPIHAAGRLRRPVIFFQGLDDRVVPPGQSAAMAEALRDRGVRVELVTFAGEGHGFRRAETIARALDAEYAFYREVLGLPQEIP